jgi:predicted ATP-dependent protease
VGAPFIYQLLYGLDEEFKELFKIKAHMDIHVDAGDKEQIELLKSARYVLESRELMDMDRAGMARLLELSRELSGYQDKITLCIKDIEEILVEADFWARKEGAERISASHLQRAVDEKRNRSALYQEHLQELLERDIIRVETSGAKTGQINGLAVYNLGDAVFGKPSRITVNIAMGKEGVVNIEREAELSGKIHTKGVMILAGYLRSAFAARFPLTLRATICFEQSYGMIDGDSASGAELFALLSAISGVPIKQSIACTGAVSQKGEILPVGGVTEKIEGFFELCRARGLDGSHGVIIPKANVRDLHLRQEIVDAVAQGKFSVWAVQRVEEAAEILTGIKAGEPDEEGNYPADSLFGKVQQQLMQMFQEARRLMKEKDEEK